MSSPNRLTFVPRGGALFTESSFLFLTWGSQWLQAKEPVGPMAVRGTTMGDSRADSVAHGCRWDHPWLSVWPWLLVCPEAIFGSHGCPWDHPWLTVWPEAVLGTVMFSVARGCWWHLWLSLGLEVRGGACGGRSGLRPVGGPSLAPRSVPSRLPSPAAPAGTLAVEISALCSQKCPFRLLCSPPGTVAVLKLVTSAFTQTLPSQLSAFAVGARPLPTCQPPPALLVKVHLCKYVHIK